MEEDDGIDPVALFMSLDGWEDDSLSFSSSSSQPTQFSTETYLVGFLMVDIVGVQYYSGRISGRELVGLVREPLNPYDGNAIKVLNTRSQQVGHIERSVAVVLAPMIDSRLINVEGIVPNSFSSSRYRIPCQVHIFARIEDFDRVKLAIVRGRLTLFSHVDVSFGLSEAVVVKETVKDRGNKKLDEIFKLVDEKVTKQGEMGSLEPPNHVIKSQLFAHQKQGLWWLVNRESTSQLPPFWEENDGDYVNVLTNYCTNIRPEPLQGGIFADDMGLGKTLTLLCLIAFDKLGDGSSVNANGGNNVEAFDGVDESSSVLTGKKGRGGRLTVKSIGGRKRRKINVNFSRGNFGLADDYSTPVYSSKTTLIVCPPVVVSSWVSQLEEHTHRGAFSVYLYHGVRTKDVDYLRKHDIVLTTYSTLASEDSWVESPVKKMHWWRVILDEAHVIKNVGSQQSQAIAHLKSKRRWAVTGTPIQNGSYDLFSLMAFLHFEPFCFRSYWQSLVQRPIAQGKKKGLSRLQVLMATLSLRRTKDKALVGLASKTMETHYIELSGEERELYDQMEVDAKGVIQNMICAGNLMRNYSTVLCLVLRLRQICNHVALCPSDLKCLLPSNNIEDVSNNPELLKKVVAVLRDGEDFDCPICISPPTDVVITCCAHIFCRTCIVKTLQRTKSCCPLCRHPLSTADLFSAPPEESQAKITESSSGAGTSSKVSALLKLLIASRVENPSRKSVVFSQFRKMLDLLEEPLKAAGFKIVRLDGLMSVKKRAEVIQEFGGPGPEGPTVLLASLKASGAGINLTVASKVYLLEPWWNPAVEEQAMDRVHRIGQKEDVTIVRLIARNSIEERVLDLQERKKKLAKEIFGGRKGLKAQTEVSMDDFCALMSL